MEKLKELINIAARSGTKFFKKNGRDINSEVLFFSLVTFDTLYDKNEKRKNNTEHISSDKVGKIIENISDRRFSDRYGDNVLEDSIRCEDILLFRTLRINKNNPEIVSYLERFMSE